MPEVGWEAGLSMHDHHIEDMVRRLGPVLTDKAKAHKILTRYWRNKIAIVWNTEDVHRAANELEVALTERQAVQVLDSLLDQHNAKYGLRWEDITTHIKDNVLGRKLTRPEVRRFVEQDILTIQR
jgi:hypothetical protein